MTQLKWRLAEGGGEAIYEIGVGDNGDIVGLDSLDMAHSLLTLRSMAAALRADVTITRTEKVGQHKEMKECWVRRRPTNDSLLDLRIAILGDHAAGKSTLLGVVSHSVPDNGRGRARLSLLRHRHEIETGHTSSISHEILGFTEEGELVNYSTANVSSWQEICESISTH